MCLDGTVQLCFCGLLSIVEPNEKIFHVYGDRNPCFSKPFLSERVLKPVCHEQWVTNDIFLSLGLTCTEQNFITKAAFQQAAAEHGLIVVAPDTSPRKFNKRMASLYAEGHSLSSENGVLQCAEKWVAHLSQNLTSPLHLALFTRLPSVCS